MSRDIARQVLSAESNALAALARRLGPDFDQAVSLILEAPGRVVLTGMGKSGLAARKIAATLASTGTPALFMHPAEGIHGDLGMIVGGDLVIALSQSGETNEVIALIETLRRIGARMIAVTGNPESTLAREADLLLDTSVEKEGCPLGLAPMASTAVMLGLGDALAAALMVARGFSAEDFARLHPGGRLGRQLARVEQRMHSGEGIPRVSRVASMRQVVLEMSQKRLGCTAVVDEAGRLLGIITDGDLRRLLERDPAPLDRCAGEVMTKNPVTVQPKTLASAALKIMEDRKITMLPVVGEGQALVGLVQIHDLWRTQLV